MKLKITLFLLIYIALIYFAYLQRGYFAIGGEIALPILPMIYYMEEKYDLR